MGKRISTPGQQEEWRKPKSDSQYKLTIASKDFIERLDCFPQVHELLAQGARPRDVAILIQRHDENLNLSFNLIKKFAHVYQLFFIPRSQKLRAQAAMPHPCPFSIAQNRLRASKRIYTREQKESFLRENGFLRMPKSHRQEELAIASKEYIESRGGFSQIRQLLAKGERPHDVAALIQQSNQFPKLTFNSIKKYAQVYRSFFIPPLETVRILATEERPSQSTIVKKRLAGLEEALKMIELLEEQARLQFGRIKDLLKIEKELGTPLRDLHLEINTERKLLTVLLNKKFELGLYSRASR